MTAQWSKDSIFYHIYPLGLCGAPQKNNFNAPAVNRLEALYPWLDHIQLLGANALYLGPVFQSSSHGYDTADYFQIDRRLGDNDFFARFADATHQRGIRLILDGVFNHVGRDFWAFKDVLVHGQNSAYVDWFHNLRFGESSPQGDPFQYEGWHGHYSLVKLNLAHPNVRDHLFNAVGMWMDQFGIDGLRLDAADCIDFDFLRELNKFTKSRRSDFWLMGEVVHGDYREWVNPETLDSVTNYECYKGLYSSLVDTNYFEIAYSLKRQFGEDGLYRNLWLYNFVDNHDVDRVASKLNNPALLYPLYLLLFTMPGIPSIYYGSEWGVEGMKAQWTDAPLRPSLDLNQMRVQSPQPDLANVIQRLGHLRSASKALKYGDYQELHVDHQQFAFIRKLEDEVVVVILNSASESVEVELSLPWHGTLIDRLNPDATFQVNGSVVCPTLPPAWGRVLSFDEIKK
jgi:glycosidase